MSQQYILCVHTNHNLIFSIYSRIHKSTNPVLCIIPIDLRTAAPIYHIVNILIFFCFVSIKIWSQICFTFEPIQSKFMWMSNEQNRPGLKIKNFNRDFLVICRFSRYFNADEFEGIEGAVSPYNIINYLVFIFW